MEGVVVREENVEIVSTLGEDVEEELSDNLVEHDVKVKFEEALDGIQESQYSSN